jgi:hypothetical protein
MGKPIARADGICMAFPDVCNTPSGPSMVPVPYPNVAQLADATGTASTVTAGGKAVIVKSSEIPTSSGDEAGSGGGVTSGTTKGKCTFTSASGTVFAEGTEVVRQFDSTDQNSGNAQGKVMVGFPTVMVGD